MKAARQAPSARNPATTLCGALQLLVDPLVDVTRTDSVATEPAVSGANGHATTD